MMKTIAFLLTFFWSFKAFCVEEILNFESFADVQPDASVIVTERITVNREGNKIKRGIYRELPLTKGIAYQAISVLRDGKKEPFFVEKIGGNYRINTGNDDFLPRNGVYEFTITYRAFNAVKPFDGFDEFYWNATGDGWAFPIKRASASVRLPDGARVLQKAVYIGRYGSTERGLISGDVFFADRELKAGEGLTFAVGFEKGAVVFPSKVLLYLPAVFAYAVLILFMFVTWRMYGKDPPKEEIMPRYDGVPDLTAAQCAYIYTRGREIKKCLSIAFIESAISGFFKIEENDEEIRISKEREAKTQEERFFAGKLFFPLVLEAAYSPRLTRFFKTFSNRLKKTAGKAYFATNTGLVVLSAFIMGGLTLWLAYETSDIQPAAVLLFYTPFFIVGISSVRSNPVFSLIWLGVTGTHCVLLMMVMIKDLESVNFSVVLAFYAAGLISLGVYAFLIYRPTRRGQAVLAHLDGLKMFMKAVHQDMPKEISFEKMEKLLPFAILFNIEKEWCEKIRNISKTFSYQPDWYVGRPFSSSKLGRIASNVSKCTTSPRRSGSGSGGGGFSGGGGGGGGGGGR